MRAYTNRQSEQGVVVLAVFVLLICAAIVAAFFFVKHAQDKKSVSTTAAEAVSAGGSAITRNAENVQRRNDAALVVSATVFYMSNNTGKLPTSFTGDMLKGMGHYTSVSIVSGEQDGLTTDQLRLVTGGVCTNGGATIEGPSARHFAVQFATEKADGSFEAECQTN